MDRKIFVGSSTESLSKAENIRRILSSVDSVKAELWKKWFHPGFLTYEALEEMLCSCCGAVFVATADDPTKIRDRKVFVPRGNVLLEFGLVAGRLGMHNVAMCQYDRAVLPSDLKGLTVIQMDCEHANEAEKKLRIWASRLLGTVDTISRTHLVHGYTGRWDFKLHLDKWRDFHIRHNDYAQVNGTLDLYLAASGQTGQGVAHARLVFKIASQNSDKPFQGEFHTSHEITDAFCHTDGSLELTTQAFAVQKISGGVGKPPLKLGGLDTQLEPWSSRWKLSPGSQPRTLEGTVTTESSMISHGRVRATRIGGLE